MGILIQKLIAYLMPVVGDFVANWLAAHTNICPASNPLFCQFWPSVVGILLGGLAMLGIHPNGTNGAAKAPQVDVIGKTAQALGAKFATVVGQAVDKTKPDTGNPYSDSGQ